MTIIRTHQGQEKSGANISIDNQPKYAPNLTFSNINLGGFDTSSFSSIIDKLYSNETGIASDDKVLKLREIDVDRGSGSFKGHFVCTKPIEIDNGYCRPCEKPSIMGECPSRIAIMCKGKNLYGQAVHIRCFGEGKDQLSIDTDVRLNIPVPGYERFASTQFVETSDVYTTTLTISVGQGKILHSPCGFGLFRPSNSKYSAEIVVFKGFDLKPPDWIWFSSSLDGTEIHPYIDPVGFGDYWTSSESFLLVDYCDGNETQLSNGATTVFCGKDPDLSNEGTNIAGFKLSDFEEDSFINIFAISRVLSENKSSIRLNLETKLFCSVTNNGKLPGAWGDAISPYCVSENPFGNIRGLPSVERSFPFDPPVEFLGDKGGYYTGPLGDSGNYSYVTARTGIIAFYYDASVPRVGSMYLSP